MVFFLFSCKSKIPWFFHFLTFFLKFIFNLSWEKVKLGKKYGIFEKYKTVIIINIIINTIKPVQKREKKQKNFFCCSEKIPHFLKKSHKNPMVFENPKKKSHGF